MSDYDENQLKLGRKTISKKLIMVDNASFNSKSTINTDGSTNGLSRYKEKIKETQCKNK